MAVKNQKLHEQFAAAASSSSCSGSSSGNIFSGVSIFVDGYTVPSSQVILKPDACWPLFFYFEDALFVIRILRQ